MALSFRKLTEGWNAEPNAPNPRIEVHGDIVSLSFRLNQFTYPEVAADERAELRFERCAQYRLGAPNDEGWFRGEGRFARVAPSWGEFYEITGDVSSEAAPFDWIVVTRVDRRSTALRHFLFYFRDGTFECLARDWHLNRLGHQGDDSPTVQADER